MDDHQPDPVELVRRSYDAIGEAYAAARHPELPPLFERFVKAVHRGRRILDAGCGAGEPIGPALLSQGVGVIGTDISATQLRLNRANNMGYPLAQADLRRLPFLSRTFDGIVSTYAVIHIPRAEHARVFREFRRVLADHSHLLVTIGEEQWDGVEAFHGADMYWSHYGRDRSRELIREAGFDIAAEATDGAGGERHAVFLAVATHRR